MIETKNGKIRNYKAFKENLIRPYKKNGKLISCRIIVKKIGKHTGGNEADRLSEIYKKPKFTKEDIETIKAAMVIRNTQTDEVEQYDPYNIGETIKNLATDGELGGIRDLVLDKNDPVRHFFDDYFIEVDKDEYQWMKMSYEDYEGRRKVTIKVNYDFTGSERGFSLNIYNLKFAIDKKKFRQNCNEYVKFLKKIYPESEISVNYGTNGSNGSNSNN